MSGAAHMPGRVRLLDPATSDLDTEHDWLPEALAAIDVGPVTPAARRPPVGAPLAAPRTFRDLRDAVTARWSADARLALLTVETSPAGFVAWRGSPSPKPGREGRGVRATPTIEILALAIRRPLRNLGYGAEAVEELERQLPAGGYLAAVPRANGLSIYFWLRAGYRPVTIEEDRKRALDPAILWMRRSSLQPSEDERRPVASDT